MNTATDFSSVLAAVKQFFDNIQQSQNYSIKSMDVIAADEQCYRVILDFPYCMGEIVVNKPLCAPYRYVKIEVLSAVTLVRAYIVVVTSCTAEHDDEVLFGKDCCGERVVIDDSVEEILKVN